MFSTHVRDPRAPILTLGYRDQHVWGGMIATALFAGGTGAGAYFMSKILFSTGVISSFTASTSGWIELFFAATGIFFLTIHLGRPLRFLNAIRRPQSAWISRGAIIPPMFVLFVFVSLLPSISALQNLPWREGTVAWKTIVMIAMVLGIGYIMYTGMVISTWNSIPFWNTPLIPIIFTAASLMGGTAITEIVMAFRGITSPIIDLIVMGFIIGNAVLIALLIIDSRTREKTIRESMRRFINLGGGIFFWMGILLVGFVLPLALVMIDYWASPGGALGRTLLVIAGIAILIGGLCQRYCVLKAGRYRLPI